MDNGDLFALLTIGCFGLVIFFAWLSDYDADWKSALAGLASMGVLVFAGLTIAENDAEWSGSILEKAIFVLTAAGAVALVLGMAGVILAFTGIFVVGLPLVAFKWVRRYVRIAQSARLDYDDDGYRVHRDETGGTYYVIHMGGTRAYPIHEGFFRTICAWRTDEGHIVFCKRDGSRPRRIPRRLRRQAEFLELPDDP